MQHIVRKGSYGRQECTNSSEGAWNVMRACIPYICSLKGESSLMAFLLCAAHDITVDAVHLMALSEAPSSTFSGALQEHRTTLSFAFLDAAAGFYYVGSA